jgi:HK97 family phage major capsid protein
VKLTLDRLREMPSGDLSRLRGDDLADARRLVRDAQRAAFQAMQRITDSAGGRALTQSQQRDYNAAQTELDELAPLVDDIDDVVARSTVDRSGVVAPGGGMTGRTFREGQPLTAEQRMTDYVQSRGLVREDQQELSFGRYVRGLLTGDWAGADAERRALVEGTATAGGHLVPTPLSARIIDRARNAARVMQAGAQIVPMESQTLKLARVVGDPAAAWHSEMATIAASDMTFDAVTFTARTLASRVLISRELIEDAAGVDDEVERAFAEQFSLTVDLAALYGSGTAPEPLGVRNHAGVTKTALDANGRPPVYDDLIDSVFRVRERNHEPNGIIYAPRTARTFARAKDANGAYLTPPTALDDVRRLDTRQVPTNLTQGTSTTSSDIFTADWRELLIGVRTQLEIGVLRERSADVGAYELMAWWRGDVQVARPAAFDVVTGVTA